MTFHVDVIVHVDLGPFPLGKFVGRRRPGKGLLVHSDRGSQYASGRFQALLKDQGYVCSMSRKGNCWDNAPAESFFHTLKTELLHHRRFETREQANSGIGEEKVTCFTGSGRFNRR
ncbi:hypothetical protein JCM19379_03180 [Methyloparacoccus murrellii]